MQRVKIAILIVLIAAAIPAAGAQQVTVSKEDAQAWARYTVPLPKSMDIPAMLVIPKGTTAVVAPAGSDMVIAQACKELGETLGTTDASLPPASLFKITLQLGGPGSERLTSLKNSDQAYSISPEADGTGLRLVALTGTGLYYAAKTLQQLVKPYESDTELRMPLVSVTDWPDLEDRGTWGSDNFDYLRWFGDRKLNIVEQISGRELTPDGRGHSGLKEGREPMITEGPLYGIKAVPAILHLEQVSGCGLFDVYPNLKGKCDRTGPICYSQPQFVDVLADWISDLASLPNTSGVDVWMAENLHGLGGCKCAECMKTDRSVLEARVIYKAWRKAEERLGRNIQLYILTSEETVKANPLILAEMPTGVRFWYYQWLTYNTSEEPMVKPYLQEAAKKGQWIGVVPNLDSMTHFMEPFHGAEFINYRMNEFVDKGMKGLLGYVTPLTHFNYYNLEAAAEWSWNSKGRTPQEFALSYAIRQGIKNPTRWAEWARLVGPVEWDIYGSEWTSGAQRGVPPPVATSLIDGTLPRLGYVLWDCFHIPFGQFKTVKQLDGDVANAAEALQIAKEMGTPVYWYESLVADGYMKSLKALWELRGLVKSGAVAIEDRETAGRYFTMYFDGLKQASEAMPKWEELKDSRQTHSDFTKKATGVCDRLRQEMAVTATKLGFEARL